MAIADRLNSRMGKIASATLALALAFTGLSATLTPTTAAQADGPGAGFDCFTPTFFAVAEAPQGTGRVYKGSYNADGTASFTEFPDTTTTYTGANLFNALAFNPVISDHYLYGITYGQATGSGLNGRVARIDSAGAMTILGATTPALGNPSNTLWDSGTFDDAGNYYVASGNNGTTTISKISNISTTRTLTTVPLVASVGGASVTADFADLTFKDGFLWGHDYGASATAPSGTKFWRINPANGVATAYNSTVLASSNYGSAFTMSNGNLAFINDAGRLYQIAVGTPTATPTFTLVSDIAAETNSRSDATNCVSAPADLSITKTAPPMVAVGSNITWTLTVKNESAAPTAATSSGFIITDTLPAGVGTPTFTPTGACSYDAGTRKVTCSSGILTSQQSRVFTITAPVTAASGSTLSNTANVLGNEGDLVSSNNTTPVVNSAVVTSIPAPVANPDSFSTATGTTLPISYASLTANDTGSTTVSSFTATSTQGGAVTANGSTGVNYVPATGFSGTDTFTYTITNATGSSTATVTVTVNNVFTPGTAVTNGKTTPQNTAVSVPVNQIATVNGKPIGTVTLSGTPTNGTVTFVGNVPTFTPTPGYTGAGSFTVNVCDTSSPVQCSLQTIPVTIGANVVTANPDTATTNAVTKVNVDVRNGTAAGIQKDTSATGQALANPTITAAPSNGVATVLANGTIDYTPNAGFSGTDVLTYRVCDTSTPTPVCSSTTLTITVNNVFTPGTAVTAGKTTGQNTPVTVPVAEIATTTGLPIGSITLSGTPTNGTVAIVNNVPTFTPTAGYTGPGSFTVNVCDTRTPTPQCSLQTIPVTIGANVVTANPDTATTNAVTKVNVDVRNGTAAGIQKDTSATGQPLANPTITSAPSNGVATVLANGTIDYTPNAGFSGTDVLTYRVCDTSTPTPVCSSTTLTITVNNVFTPGTAVTTGKTTGQNTPVTVPVAEIATTTGLPIGSITLSGTPTNGTVAIVNNVPTFTPTAGYTGSGSFTVNVCDTRTPTPQCSLQTIPVTIGANVVDAKDDTATTNAVTKVNVDVRNGTAAGIVKDTTSTGQPLANPTVTIAPAHGTATVLANGTIDYTPATAFSGTDVFTYRVCDTSTPTPVCDTATVTVTVNNVFTPGTAVTTGVTTPQNTAISVPVAQIATTTGLPVGSVTISGTPVNGTVSFTGNVPTFTPTPGYTGAGSFQVNVCDTRTPTPQCTVLTIPVTIGANVVTARPDTAATNAQTLVNLDVRNGTATGIQKDTSATGQPLANPTVTSNPSHGTATVLANGTIDYTPVGGFSGTDVFSYRVCDTSAPTPVCDTTTATITVNNVFTPGTAVTNGTTTPQNTPVTVPINDIVTTTGLPLGSITLSGVPSNGTVSIVNNVPTFTPAAGFTGTGSFQVNACDTRTPTPQCTVLTIPVVVGGNVVTANPDTATTNAVTTVNIDVRNGTAAGIQKDTSATGQALANPTVITAAAHGTATVKANGTIDYLPASGFSGTDVFSYRVCDTSAPTPVCSSTTVTVTVNNVFTPGTAVTTGKSTPQNTPVTVSVAEIATTSGLPIGAITLSGTPTNGTVAIVNNVPTFTPTAGYTGSGSFTVNVCDTASPTPQCSLQTIPVTIGANVVTANPDTATTNAVTKVNVDVRNGSAAGIQKDTSATGQPLANPTITSAPSNGTAAVLADGTIDYTPNAGFSGTDVLTYRVCDTSTPTPVCSSTTLTITVTNVFTPGTAVTTGKTTAQNTPVTVPVAEIATTSGKPVGTVTISGTPVNGTVSFTGNVPTFTPTPGYTGSGSFTVNVCDTSSPVQCSLQTIPVTIGANVVDAKDDTATTNAVTKVNVDVRNGTAAGVVKDTTSTGQPLANPTVTVAPAHGTATVLANGTIDYTPAAGFSGTDVFTYRVCDTSTPTAVCDTATVTVTVNNVFTPGAAVSTGVSTPQNTAIPVPVAQIATTTGLPVGSVTISGTPVNGTVSFTGNVPTFTPTPGYTGSGSFQVNVCDTLSPTPECAVYTIPVTIGANVVDAKDDTASTPAQATVNIDVRNGSAAGIQKDTSASGQALANPTVTTAPTHGTATVRANGTIDYTPAAGFSGTDTFSYSVCDTSSPTAVCDTAVVTVAVANVFTPGTAVTNGVSTPQNTPVTVPVNDIVTTKGLPIGAVTLSGTPVNGTVSIVNNVPTFTPNAGYTGSGSFSVQVCDTKSPTPECTTVVIPVTIGGNVVDAKDDTATTNAVTTVNIDVRNGSAAGIQKDTSSTGQPLANPTVTTAPAHGTATVLANGTIDYTPAAGFSGTDTFSYQVCDTSFPTPVCDIATVTVTVNNVFSAGTAVTAGKTTPQNTAVSVPVGELVVPQGLPVGTVTLSGVPSNGSVSIVNNVPTFTPTAGYTGPGSYTVQVCDTESPTPECATVTVPVTVGGNVVDAKNDTATTNAVTTVNLDVRNGSAAGIQKDTSATGQALANPTVTTAPAHGTTTVKADGTIDYLPAAGFSGTDVFSYQVCDTSTPTPVCDTATVTVTVNNVFTPGAAVSTGVTTPQNTAINVPVAQIATTTGLPIGSVTISGTPVNGTVSFTGNVPTFTPTPGFTGSGSFAVQVCDTLSPTPQCTTLTIPVTVGANVVDAKNDTATTNAVTKVNVDVRNGSAAGIQKDTSATGQALANPTVTVAPAHGTATVLANGTVDYTPAAGFSGTDVFSYQVCDTSTPTPVCDTATVTVTVSNVFVPGTAVTTGKTTPQNTAVTVPVAQIATTTGLPVGSVTISGTPVNGTVSFAGNVPTFTPTAGYTGSGSFQVNVCDTLSPTPECTIVTIPVTIGANVVDAKDDTATTNAVTKVNVDVRNGTAAGIVKDTTSTGQPLANPTVTVAPAHGTATVLANGTIDYTPAAGFSGTDVFTYQVCDTSTPTAVCDTATVTVTVNNVFTPGAAVSTGVTTPQNTAINVPVAQIATTTGLPIGSVTISGTPVNGTVSFAGNVPTFTPTPGYTGAGSFAVNVCDTLSPTPQCTILTIPVAIGANVVDAKNDTATTNAVTKVNVDVRNGSAAGIQKDTSASGQALANPTVTVAPDHGTATVLANGTIDYTPAAGFSGTDTFSYSVCDTSSPTPVCDTATVTVTVNNVFLPGTAVTGGVSTPQNTPVSVPTNDIASTTGLPIATVTLSGVPVNGTVAIVNNVPTFTPTPGYTGPGSFAVQVCDAESPTPECATVIIPVTIGGNVVDAKDDTATTAATTAVNIDVRNGSATGIQKDTSASGQALASPTVAVAPLHGTATVLANGTIDYTPAAGFSGTDSFTYSVCDTSTPTAVCDTAVVTITVTNVFVAGTAVTVGKTTPQNSPVTVPLSELATSRGLPIASVTLSGTPANGTVSIVNNVPTFTPDIGFTGDGSFDVTVCDAATPTPECATLIVIVRVGENVVEAADETASIQAGRSARFNVMGSGVSETGQPFAAPTVTAQPANGVATVLADGTIEYVPRAGFVGSDFFIYELCDTSSPTPVCDTAVISINVSAAALAFTGVDGVAAGMLGAGGALVFGFLLLLAKRRRRDDSATEQF